MRVVRVRVSEHACMHTHADSLSACVHALACTRKWERVSEHTTRLGQAGCSEGLCVHVGDTGWAVLHASVLGVCFDTIRTGRGRWAHAPCVYDAWGGDAFARVRFGQCAACVRNVETRGTCTFARSRGSGVGEVAPQE